jgi:aerobic C4-dicarboxylate transport protein
MGKIPVAGMVLLLGVDRFMSEARAITNTIGNAVGTVVVARWVGAVDRSRMQRILDGEEPEREAAVAPQPAELPEVGEGVVVGLVKHQNASA